MIIHSWINAALLVGFIAGGICFWVLKVLLQINPQYRDFFNSKGSRGGGINISHPDCPPKLRNQYRALLFTVTGWSILMLLLMQITD
jgi:hypothetical protein